jgi:hypothetical protein
MPIDIEAEAVTTYEVAADGTRFSLNFRRASGEVGSITLPSECLNQLVMTMPCIAAEALRKRYRNSTMRLVYPLGDWSLAATDCSSRLILTLKTPDGFQIAFSVDPADVCRIGEVMSEHVDGRERSPSRMN